MLKFNVWTVCTNDSNTNRTLIYSDKIQCILHQEQNSQGNTDFSWGRHCTGVQIIKEN